LANFRRIVLPSLTIFRLVRFPNLLIIALTQILLGYILYESIDVGELSQFQFGLLILTTVFIAASGYVINDIYDFEIDLINKPQKVIVGKLIFKNQAWMVYWWIVVVGGLIAIYLAYVIQDFKQLFIYPSAILLLWAYAKSFKKSFVVGNLVVAAYCALVPGILWYAEREPYSILLESNKATAFYVRNVFLAYALMAFLTTVWREIIKDMEDLEGDIAFGSESIPAKYGMSLAQKMASIIGLIVIGLMLKYVSYLFKNEEWLALGYLLIPIVIAIYSTMLSFKSLNVSVLHQVSQQVKWLMVLGLGYLFFLL